MDSRLVVFFLAGATLAVGCVTPGSNVDPASAGLGLDLGLKAAATQLWDDPQNMPHPAFGWPTLSAPADAIDAPAWWKPIPAAPLPETITGMTLVAEASSEAPSGAGIALFGSLAIVPGYGDQSYILDISDPTAPKQLSAFEPVAGAHRGAATIAYPDGRLVAVFSTGAGFEAFDITDPTKPEPLSQVEPTNGGHKIGVVPGTPIVYNANSRGGGSTAFTADRGEGVTEIYDLTDPAKPVLVQDFPNGFGCHHIFFWNAPDGSKQRALCAGIEFAQIWDVADPRNPVVITNVPIPAGNPMLPSLTPVPVVAPFAHFSILNTAGNVLIVGDELGGGSLPPGCSAPGAPTGALWFYDVSDETNPTLLSWYSPGWHMEPDNVQASCTAHHGRLVPDPSGRDLLAMSFYGAGVVLVDFTDPTMPTMVDQIKGGSNTWETWYYNGYLFTGDLQRGMDVIGFE